MSESVVPHHELRVEFRHNLIRSVPPTSASFEPVTPEDPADPHP